MGAVLLGLALVCLLQTPSYGSPAGLVGYPAAARTRAVDGDVSGSRDGNRIYLLNDPVQAFQARVDMIRSARDQLDLIYFIVEGEEDLTSKMGVAAIAGTVVERRESGDPLQVRLIMDAATTSRLSVRMMYALHRAGVEIKLFHKPSLKNFLNPKHPHVLRLFLRRLHDKIMIRDHSELILGGRNIGNLYLGIPTMGADGRPKMFKRDVDIFASGPVVRDAQAFFDHLWDSHHVSRMAYKEKVPEVALRSMGIDPKSGGRKVNYLAEFAGLSGPEVESQDGSDWCGRRRTNLSRAKTCTWAFRELKAIRAELASVFEDWGEHDRVGILLHRRTEEGSAVPSDYWRAVKARPVESAQFVFDRDGVSGRKTGVAAFLRSLIDELGPGDQIWIQSPVLILGKVARKFVDGVLARGVEVHILTNGPTSTPNAWYQAGYLLTVNDSVNMGMDVCEVQNPADLPEDQWLTNHAKTMVISKRIEGHSVPILTFVGSFNLDPRSQNLNGEMGLLVRDESLAREQLDSMLDLVTNPENPHRCKRVEARPGFPLGYVEGMGDSAESRWERVPEGRRARIERIMRLLDDDVRIPGFGHLVRWFMWKQP